MRGSKAFAIGALVAVALVGRGYLPGAGEPEEELFVPILRFVDDAPVDTAWVPDPDVRDPFQPLVLPDPPAATVAEPSDGIVGVDE